MPVLAAQSVARLEVGDGASCDFLDGAAGGGDLRLGNGGERGGGLHEAALVHRIRKQHLCDTAENRKRPLHAERIGEQTNALGQNDAQRIGQSWIARSHARNGLPGQFEDARGFREDRDSRHLQTAIEILGDTEDFVRKNFIKDAFAIASAAVGTRDDAFSYHSNKGPIGILGNQRLSAPAGLPEDGRDELFSNLAIERGKSGTAAYMLGGRVAIALFVHARSQEQMPHAAGDAARLHYKTVRPLLTDPYRQCSWFVFRDEGKRTPGGETVESFADLVGAFPRRECP